MYIPFHLFVIAALYALVDRFKQNARDRFNVYARVDILVGKTGAGKSISAMYLIQQMKAQFPELLVISNLQSSLVDCPLTKDHLLQMYDKPVFVVIDEANSTFSAKRLSDVSDELRKALMQVRKGSGKRVLLLTQDYTLLDTNFRKLAHYVFEAKTFLGRLTRLRRFEQQEFETHHQTGGIDTMNGKTQKARRSSTWFLQKASLRSLYDYKALVDVNWFC